MSFRRALLILGVALFVLAVIGEINGFKKEQLN